MFGSKKNTPARPSAISFDPQGMDTLISAQCTIEGNLHTKSSIKVDGTVRGDIRADGQVILGEKGVIHGNVHSTDLLVFGRLEGNVHSQNLWLKSTAQILGNIETGSLQVDAGASYQGTVTMLGANATPALGFSGEADTGSTTPNA